MITIIGSAHVFDISDRVKEEIKKRNPAVVAVELDKGRYLALKSGDTDTRNLPFTYRAMAFLQKRIAEKFGVMVGGEMIAAIDAAKEIGSNVAFIDLPSNKVFQKLMNNMTIKEKIYLFIGMIVGIFSSKKRIEKEVEKYTESQEQEVHNIGYIGTMAEQFPTIKNILIDERNTYMAKNLLKIEERFGSVVAVVGDGHVPGLVRDLNHRQLEVIRLKDLQSKKEETEDRVSGSNTEVSFSYSYEIEERDNNQ